ncbi:SlyX family protein [Xanthomonas melonis]|uniref:Protein SlyX homolog n=1 Tax=Xanthomonas melonis TaxID=56456 RepID=A0A2S7DDF3_9XANT|nr:MULTISPECIES: SlyX family protein [Xanthomonas]MCC4588819.1 SlyX family protein [Xanthomonas sp. NCPPB 1067]MCC4601312.1 SlyX family protein [Xanthomonas melonis]MCD0244735.1 SlyX family protein [Xanthomonas melonis]MCD0257028.1 SlyX family protein [Xanthomonas melonis]MCD0265290.1 SlyX family protein [Xanthomonas melonis]
MHEQLPLHDRALEERLIELETRLSFQEQALNELSEALADARLTGARNAELIRHLLEDLGKVRSTLFADAADEPPPPHY